MMSSPLFAPDGMRVTGGVAEFRSGRGAHVLIDVVVAHERDDDGLVHSHDWAVRGSAPGKRVPGSGARPAETVRVLMEVVLPHDRHDDGLVHSHAWAMSAQ